MKRILQLGAVLVLSLAIGVGVVAKNVNTFMTEPLQNIERKGMPFEVTAGSSFQSVANQLLDKQLIESDTLLHLYVRWHDKAGSIQAGDYLIKSGTTPMELLQQLSTGDVRLYAFTLVEGWNFREVLLALHANEAVRATMTEEDWPALLASLGAESIHPEGLFLPETYRFPLNTTDRDLLGQAYALMQTVLQEEWQARNENTAVQSPYETLILASIVEKETARVDERPRIAGVFARRLEIGMRLQTDPTVIYGVGPTFDGDLTRAHMRTDTPYNTYTRHGLPPTPIAMPGRAAINAVLNPADGAELYFVATGESDGSHKFSATKAEHDAAVAEYLKRLRQRRHSGN